MLWWYDIIASSRGFFFLFIIIDNEIVIIEKIPTSMSATKSCLLLTAEIGAVKKYIFCQPQTFYAIYYDAKDPSYRFALCFQNGENMQSQRPMEFETEGGYRVYSV